MRKQEFHFHIVSAHTQIKIASQAAVEWDNRVELSVDDPVEQRVDRTVHLDENPEKSFNRSTRENYPGFIVGFESSWQAKDGFGQERLCSATYHCRLPFARFTDTKDQMESSKEISWARVSYRIQCHLCSTKTDFSSQTNQVVPREHRCACGAIVAWEDRINPQIN